MMAHMFPVGRGYLLVSHYDTPGLYRMGEVGSRGLPARSYDGRCGTGTALPVRWIVPVRKSVSEKLSPHLRTLSGIPEGCEASVHVDMCCCERHACICTHSCMMLCFILSSFFVMLNDFNI